MRALSYKPGTATVRWRRMNPLDQRLTALKIKASFNEEPLDPLNEVVVLQQRQIDALLREVADLRQQAPEASEASSFRSRRDELLPRY